MVRPWYLSLDFMWDSNLKTHCSKKSRTRCGHFSLDSNFPVVVEMASIIRERAGHRDERKSFSVWSFCVLQCCFCFCFFVIINITYLFLLKIIIIIIIISTSYLLGITCRVPKQQLSTWRRRSQKQVLVHQYVHSRIFPVR